MADCAIIGNGGGNSSDSRFGTTAPTSDIGSDGEYYYIRNPQSGNAHSYEMTGASGQNKAGWEFYTDTNVDIVGFRGKARSSTTGTLLIMTLDGTIVAQANNVQFTAGTWITVSLDIPVTLTANTHYVAQIRPDSGGVYYAQPARASAFASGINYVTGRYGGSPGNAESGVAYSVDILFSTGYNVITDQYYKENGAWTKIV